MISPVSENVASFFAEIGVNVRFSEDEVDLAIDWFDNWPNPRRAADRVTLCQCAIPVDGDEVL